MRYVLCYARAIVKGKFIMKGRENALTSMNFFSSTYSKVSFFFHCYFDVSCLVFCIWLLAIIS